MRSLMSPYSAKLADRPTRPASRCQCRIWNHGAPILMPKALASLLRAIAQPSLLDSTTTGLSCKRGWNTRSQLT